MSISFPRRAKRGIALGLGIVLAGSLPACSSGSGGASADTASADDLAKALDTQSSITV